MTTPPEVYTGAQFTVRYQECKDRITDYITEQGVTYPFGFMAAWVRAVKEGYIVPADVPYFAASLTQIVKRLELRDRFKELSSETPDAWVMLCMQRFCEVSEKYEDVLSMEAATGFDVTNPSRESRIAISVKAGTRRKSSFMGVSSRLSTAQAQTAVRVMTAHTARP